MYCYLNITHNGSTKSVTVTSSTAVQIWQNFQVHACAAGISAMILPRFFQARVYIGTNSRY